MTVPQPEPAPKPEVPDPEAHYGADTTDEAEEPDPAVVKKEQDDGTDLGEQREPA